MIKNTQYKGEMKYYGNFKDDKEEKKRILRKESRNIWYEYRNNYAQRVVCSKDAMDNLQSWSEGNIIIDLDEKIVVNKVFYTYSSEEEVKEYYNIKGNIPFINDLELSCIPFNKIDSVLERVVEMEEISDYVFKNALNEYIAFIA